MGVYVYLITPGNWEALDVVARRRRPRCLTLPGVTVSIRPGGFTAMGNLIKTGFLLVVLTSLLVLVGGAIGGQQGMTIAFVLAFVMNVGSYWFSDKIVLSMYGAQPVDEAQAPGLYRIVRELAAEAKIPVPPIYLIPDDSPNAFATGRNPQHAAVAVTEGILRIMSEDELRGVLAHELSHVKNRDTLIMTIAAPLARPPPSATAPPGASTRSRSSTSPRGRSH